MSAGKLILLPVQTTRARRSSWERADPEEQAVREEELRTQCGADRRSPSNHVCIRRLVGKRCRDYCDWRSDAGKMPCHPPRTDHASLWLKDGKAIAFVSEPYSVDMRDAVEMINFAERWHLTFEILPWASPHYPGHTMAIIWRRLAV